MLRMILGVTLSAAVGLALTPTGAAAQVEGGDCWTCWVEGTNCQWIGGELWCESAATWCLEEERGSGWVDCNHNMSQTWCDTEGYAECEEGPPHLVFLPDYLDSGASYVTAMEGGCSSDRGGFVHLVAPRVENSHADGRIRTAMGTEPSGE
jgi:hypothetical protein